VAEPTVTRDLGDRFGIVVRATLLAIGAFAAGNLVAAVVVVILEGNGVAVDGRPGRMALISTVALQGIGFGALGLAYLHYSGLRLDFLRVRWPTLRDVLVVVVAAPAILVGYVLLTNALISSGVDLGESQLVGAGEGNPVLYLVLAVASILVVGPAEELLYRGIVQRTFALAIGPVAAILATSGVFAVIHYPAITGEAGARVATVGVIFALAVVLGALYEWTETLVVPALVHGLFNATQFVVVYLQETGQIPAG